MWSLAIFKSKSEKLSFFYSYTCTGITKFLGNYGSSYIIQKSNKKGTFTINCKTLTPWSPDNKNYYKFCNGSSVSAEQIPKNVKYVEIVQGGKVRDLVDVESTIIKTKKNDTKTGRYGDINYTIFYKINL